MLRTLQIENIYERYEAETTTVTIDVKTPDEVDGDYDEYLFDTIYPHTGVGHTDGNSSYFVESIDGLEPAIDQEYGV